MNRDTYAYVCAVEFADHNGRPYTRTYHVAAHDFGLAELALKRWLEEQNLGEHDIRAVTKLGELVAQPKES